MATTPRLGTPAINEPRGQQWNTEQLRNLQQVVGNIRERFRAVDSAISTLQTATTGINATTATDLAALKKRVTNLEQALAALQAEVDGLELGGSEIDPRVEQLAGEMVGLKQQVDAIDTLGQTAEQAALLHRLTAQVDDLTRGYLI